jgi:hypothetical protein
MKPPHPAIVIALLFGIAIYTLSQGPKGTGAEAAGYLFGVLFFPAILSLVYYRWYRRRSAPG